MFSLFGASSMFAVPAHCSSHAFAVPDHPLIQRTASFTDSCVCNHIEAPLDVQVRALMISIYAACHIRDIDMALFPSDIQQLILQAYPQYLLCYQSALPTHHLVKRYLQYVDFNRHPHDEACKCAARERELEEMSLRDLHYDSLLGDDYYDY